MKIVSGGMYPFCEYNMNSYSYETLQTVLDGYYDAK